MSGETTGLDVGEQPKAKVFISYSRKDMAFADRLETALKARGFEPLIDRTEIYAFEDWWTRIQVLIAKSDTVIFVLSPDAVASDICAKEVAFAASLNKRFAPIICRRIDDHAVPESLRRLNFIFFDDETRFAESMQRLVEALEIDIHWVRKHTEFGEAARRWSEAGCPGPRGLLLHSPMLDEAERWIASRPRGAPSPTEVTQAFIAESRKAATRRRNIVSTTLGAGLIVALALAGLAYWQRGIAVQSEERAQQERTRAQQERDAALLTQSRFLASLADQNLAANDAELALLLAIEALPDAAAGKQRPYAPEAELALQQAWQRLHQIKVEDLPDTANQDVVRLSREEAEQFRTFRFEFFSPDARYYVASKDADGKIIDTATGDVLKVLHGHEQSVRGIAFSGDGRHIITWSDDRTARIWDSFTGASLQVLGGHDEAIDDAGISTDGSRIVMISAGIARIWNADTGTVMHVLKDDKRDGLSEDKRDVHYARFSPNGSRVLTVSHDGVRIWDAKTGGLLKILNEPLLESAVFSADATRVLGVPLSSQLKPKVTVWDAQSGEILSVFLGSPKFAAFNPTSEQVLLLGSQIGTWSVQPRNAGLILPHEQDVFGAAFSPDETRVITAVYGGRGRIFDAATGEALRDLQPARYGVTDVGFSPDGRTAVTISESSTSSSTKLWDAIRGNLIAEFDDKSVEFARGTGHLLSLAKNGMVRLRDGHSGTLIMEFAAGENVERVMFASDGRRVLMALKTSIQVLDPDTGATNTIIPADERIVMIGSFSPDRRRVLTLSPQRHAHVWDLDSGQMLHELAGYYEGWIHGSEFSRDGRLLLVSNDSGTWVWDVDENRIIASLHTQVTSHRKMAGSTIQFTPDSRRILELKFPNRVDVWDVATGKSVASLKHKDTILGASWDRAGHRIVTASRDHTARIWPVPETQALVNSAKNDAPRCLTQKERERAFLDPAPPAWCIEAAKWPYRSPDWKEWLAFQRHDPTVPLPETKEWATWRAARGAAVQ